MPIIALPDILFKYSETRISYTGKKYQALYDSFKISLVIKIGTTLHNN